MKPLRLVVALMLTFLALPSRAGSPELGNLLPVAGQRGTQVEVNFYGTRLRDTTAVMFHTTGITAGEITPHENNRVSTTLTIAADAPIGEHQLRLVTESGVTEMLTFQVVDKPIVRENEEEPSTMANPLMVPMGSVAIGRTRAEDVDYYGVELRQGQRLTVQVAGMSLGRGFTDSHLAVFGPDGQRVAECDDTSLLRQDPFVSFLAPQAGRYTAVIRDSGYQGNDNNWYMLHIGEHLRPAMVFPLGGRPGEQVDLRFIGDVAGDFTQRVTLPREADDWHRVIPDHNGATAPSGHLFRVNDLRNVFEGDSTTNNSFDAVAEAPAQQLPLAYNGIIEQPGDMDYFRLTLRKDQRVRIRCFASRLGSPLDSVVNVWRCDNRQHVQGNDDQGSPDSVVDFTAPEDGEYFVRVRDHLGEGGPDFVYRLEVTVPTRSLSTYVHTYDRNRPQIRQGIAIPQGNRTAALVRVRRERVGGDLTTAVEGYPAGVDFNGYSPGGTDMMPVVFEANAEAQLSHAMVNLQAIGQPRGESAERTVGSLFHVIPIATGNPNRTVYARTATSTHPVAVTEAVPFRINVVQPNAPLVHDGRIRLSVQIERDGYERDMRLYMLWRPPGMSATGQVHVPNEANEVVYEVDSNNSTDLRNWPMVIIGWGHTDNGPVWVSTQLFEITVEEPFVRGTITNTTCTRGQAVDIEIGLEHLRDWQGQGELKLLGLPAGCEVQPITIRPGQESATMRVQTAENTPPGRHQSLMCELTIQVNGEPVIHRFARGAQLRIDRPRPPRENQEGGE